MTPWIYNKESVGKSLSLDPRTKLFLLITMSILMLNNEVSDKATYMRTVSAMIPFILQLLSKRFKRATAYLLIWIGGVSVESICLEVGIGITSLILGVISFFIIRFLPCIVMGRYMVTTTTVSEFIAGMNRLYIPQQIIIPLSVMFRFFPTIKEEADSIRRAMHMRGLGIKHIFRNPMAQFEYRLIPLIISVVKIGEELSASALTRGLHNSVNRTNICSIGFGPWDFLFLSITASTLIVYGFI
jgi:energy-coupling factor transport system permease protein